MTRGWPLVPLATVAHPVSRTIPVISGEAYRTIGVRLWGEGAYERQTIDGSQTAAKTLNVVRENDLIINKIWVRHGSAAIASRTVDGCAASGEFPTFELDQNCVVPRWLHWLTKMRPFWESCDRLSQGTSGKNRIRPEMFLTIEIPLPPLQEQQCIVERIEALMGKIKLAQILRQQTAGMVDQVKATEERRIWPDASLKDAPALRDVTTFLTRGRHSQQGESNHFLIKTQHVQMGKYVRTNMTLDADVAAKVSSAAVVKPGDVLIACSAAGCLGRVAVYDDPERAASTDTHIAIARADESQIVPEYLYAYLLGAQGQHQLRSRERGDWQREKVGFRLTELNLRDLERVPVPLPPKEEQRRIVNYLHGLQAKVDGLKTLQRQTQGELDALLPSLLDRAFRGDL
jgi:type I restriction enzyme S subunit